MCGIKGRELLGSQIKKELLAELSISLVIYHLSGDIEVTIQRDFMK